MKSKRLIKNAEAKAKERDKVVKKAIYFSIKGLKNVTSKLIAENKALKARIGELEKENKALKEFTPSGDLIWPI